MKIEDHFDEIKYNKALKLLLKDAPIYNDNIRRWEAHWHRVAGFVITHLAYLQIKYGKKLKYCIKETSDSINAVYVEELLKKRRVKK